MVDQKPDCRCGYVSNYTNPFEPGRSCCFRKKAPDAEYCAWHIRERNKSLRKLTEEYSPSRIVDEAYLVGVDAQKGLSLQNWELRGANLSSSNLSGVILAGADLTAANLSNSNLRNANLTDTTLTGADLTHSNLRYSDLTNATLHMIDARRAIFIDTNLDGTKFKWAFLRESVFDSCKNASPDFTDANLADAQIQDAEFDGANFLRANLSRANLFDTNFTRSTLYGAVLTNARVNENTTFGEYLETERFSEGSKNSEEKGDQYSTTKWSRSKWVYRQLEQLARNNALHMKASEFYLERKQIQMLEDFEGNNWLRARGRQLSFLISKHGESPKRIIVTSALVILSFAITYSFLGGVEQIQNPIAARYSLHTLTTPHLGIPTWVENLFRNAYFSSLTFLGVNFGDTAPSTPIIQVLAGIEALIGTLLTAFFIFVLGRQTVR